MTPHLFKKILKTVPYLIIFLASCGQVHEKNNVEIIKSETESNQLLDSSKTAIILFDQKSNYPFANSHKPATLTQVDIHNIDSLLFACVSDYNNSLNNGHKQWNIDFTNRNYRKQLIAVTNSKGEKEVWVNCFCNTWRNDKWKTEIMAVKDGGNCYFNFKINLTTKIFYELRVNGDA